MIAGRFSDSGTPSTWKVERHCRSILRIGSALIERPTTISAELRSRGKARTRHCRPVDAKCPVAGCHEISAGSRQVKKSARRARIVT